MKTFLMSLFILLGFFAVAGSCYAQTADIAIWENKWFKVSVTNAGWCQSAEPSQQKYSHHNNGLYLNIGTVDEGDGTFPITIYIYDKTVPKWVEMPLTVHYMASDSLHILGYVQEDLAGTVGTDTVGLTLRIAGKLNRRSELTSGTFKTLAGYTKGNACQIDCEGHDLNTINFGGVVIKGALIDSSKVPVSLLTLVEGRF